MKRLNGFIFIIFCLIFSNIVQGNKQVCFSVDNLNDIEQDTLIYRELEKIDIYPRKGFKMNSREYTRLVAKIKKVYPFAKEAAIELNRYNEMYEKITSPRKRKQYVRKIEKELFSKHENDIRHITVSEGRYLLLLIDRETGDCSYELIKEIKGSFSAFFWQGIAKIFHNDLREEYDPVYKHFVIEQIVQNIEQGKL